MKKEILKLIVIIGFVSFLIDVSAQDIVCHLKTYRNDVPTQLDSIRVINLSNNSSVVYNELPNATSYILNLSKGSISVSNKIVLDQPEIEILKNLPGQLTFKANGFSGKESKLMVYNLKGQMVYYKDLSLLQDTELTVHLAKNQMYIINIYDGILFKSIKALGSSSVGSTRIYESNVINYYSKKLKSISLEQNNSFKVSRGDTLELTGYLNGFYPVSKVFIVTDANFSTLPFITGVVKDIEGNEYKTVKIGKQWWMAENLKTTIYPNGNKIELCESEADWEEKVSNGGYGYFDFIKEDSVGILYNYMAAMALEGKYDKISGQGICPDGWHLPTNKEWKVLVNSCYGDEDMVGENIKSVNGWLVNGNGSDNFGFNAKPEGRYSYAGFNGKGIHGTWWCKNESELSMAFLEYDNNKLSFGGGKKKYAYSIRCVKDSVYSALTPSVCTKMENDVTTTSAIINGLITNEGGDSISEFGFEFSDEFNFELGRGEKVGLTLRDNGLIRTKINNLIPETTYYYRAFAKNKIGISYGAELSFKSKSVNVTDIDNNSYKTVIVGDQVWMAENLKVSRYPNGDTITSYSNTTNWVELNSIKNLDIRYFNTDKEQYGAYYTWNAAVANETNGSNTVPSGIQGVCPTGWHLPSDSEWSTLIRFARDDGYLNKDGLAFKSKEGWDEEGNGIDIYGFDVLASGYVTGKNHIQEGSHASFWTTSVRSSEDALTHFFYSLWQNSGGLRFNKSNLTSVRCIRDKAVKKEKPYLETGLVNAIYDTSVVVLANLINDGGDSILNRGIEYSTDSLFELGTGFQVMDTLVELGNYEISLNNLEPSTKYFYRAFATNTIGRRYGLEKKFVTRSTIIYGSVSDIEGHSYKTVQIGKQVWMANDLKVTTYPNGDSIPLITNNISWGKLGDTSVGDACCYYSNDSDRETVLYTWSAALGDSAKASESNPSGVQGVCPKGWHLPSSDEYIELLDYMKSNCFEGGVPQVIKSRSGWINDQNGWDYFGFNAESIGYRNPDSDKGYFSGQGNFGYWWTSTEYDKIKGVSILVKSDEKYVMGIFRLKSSGHAVRCVMD